LTSVTGNDLDYTADAHREELTDGTPWFIAEHPDLPGCMSDGPTEPEAFNNLDVVRGEYIESFIEDGLPNTVPA